MIVVHGTWVKEQPGAVDGRLFVWGESLAGATPYRRGRPPRRQKDNVPLHPWQASEQELISALLDLSAGQYRSIPLVPPGLDKIQMLLPSVAATPLPSPELRHLPGSGEILKDRESRENKAVLSPWEINGLAVSPVWVMAVLAGMREGLPGPCRGHIIAADLYFWSLAAKMVLELLARERFIPVVTGADIPEALKKERARGKIPARTELKAAWRALLDHPDDSRRMALLAKAMPPACYAMVTPLPPRELLEDFFHGTVDAMARHWLQASSLDGRGRGLGDHNLAARLARALAAEKSTLTGPPLPMDELREQLNNWTRALDTPKGASDFRTCFRLEPPPGPEEGTTSPGGGEPTWELHFLLQAADDPSLLVPANKVWREKGGTLEFLNRRLINPQERLLADLGRAARIFPPLEKSLASPSPDHCPLTTAEAYDFLREAAPLLAESGFGVLLPPWWGQKHSRLGLRLRLKNRRRAHTSTRQAASSPAGLGLASLVDYELEVALGEEIIDRREFERLATLKVPLVRLRGQWVELRPEELAALARFWREGASTGVITAAEAVRLGLAGGQVPVQEPGTDGGLPGDPGLPVLRVEAEGDLGSLLEKLRDNHKIALLKQPPGFKGNLRPYQVRGFSWLNFLTEMGLGACLADDMGLGKTIQLLALLLHRKSREPQGGPVLLLCPTSVAGNWQREVARFAPSLRVLLHHGSERLSGAEFVREARGQDMVISTYTLAHRDAAELLAVDWSGVVLDEAQNIKNPETKQTRSIRRLRAGFRVALTGTPVENHLGELWSIMDFLNPGYLGSQSDFRNRFIIPIERYRDRERAALLRRLVQPFILRRVKTDPAVIQDLPAKQEIKVFCHLTREQATLYEAVVKDMLEKIETATDIQRKGLVLATLAKLKQVCNHPAQFLGDGSSLTGRSGKMARLVEMLEEVLANNERALIFTQFAEMGQLLREHLEEVFKQEVLFLHGGVSRLKRENMVRRFQEEEKGPPLFILSLKAGGVGLNLTRANHVFHFDRWWNPAVEDQATDRAFRIGQQRNVQVYKFVCAGTLEEKIDALIEEKRALAGEIIGSGESWLTEMSTRELRELLALRDKGIDL